MVGEQAEASPFIEVFIASSLFLAEACVQQVVHHCLVHTQRKITPWLVDSKYLFPIFYDSS